MKVKLFKTERSYSDFDDSYRELTKGITVWEEVDEETLKLLEEYQSFHGYIVVRQIEQEEFNTVIAAVVREMQRRKKAFEKDCEDRLKKQAAHNAKVLERKLARAKKLLEQHGATNG